MRTGLTAGERLASDAWSAGDHRPRCPEGHLVCRGCQVCSCDSAEDGMGASLSHVVRVMTDKDGHTWCQECRYEYREYGNYRAGVEVDDTMSAAAWRNAWQNQR